MVATVIWISDAPLTWLGQPDTEEKKEEEKIEKVETKLDVGEKVLIASLFLNVVALAWSVYQWKATKS